MKVLHINCNYTGNQLHRTMIEHLSDFQIDNYVFAPVYEEDKVVTSDSKVQVSKCFKKWNRIFFNYKSKKIRVALMKNYNILDFDLIHAYTLFTDGNVAYKLKKEYPNMQYVVAIRNTDVNTFFKYMFHLRRRGIEIMKEASAIFFLSNAYKNEVFNKYIPENVKKELEEKTYIIPNGIDDFWISECYTEKKEIKNSKVINIIYAGRIDANKNIETTQKALKLLRKKGYKTSFSVVGKIENKKVFDKIMKYADTYYYGSKNKKELKELYRKNDIFIMPSLTETFGLVYAEAMSQGLPVIYTKGQGFDGQFKEGEIGYSVNPRYPKEIVQKVLLIINNYKCMSKRCVRLSKKFEWKLIVSQYCKIYERIIKNEKK